MMDHVDPEGFTTLCLDFERNLPIFAEIVGEIEGKLVLF